VPGLAGFVSGESGQSAARATESMTGVISESWYRTERFVDEEAGVAIGRSDPGIVNTAQQPYVTEDGSVRVWIYGDIYRSVGAADFRRLASRAESVIAQDYRNSGIAFAGSYSGEFLIVLLDLAAGKLILSGDRYGRRPAYLATARGAFVFGSEIKSILAVPGFSPVPDEEAFAQFLTFGYILGQKTLLGNVSLLAPGSALSCDLDSCRLEVHPYWELARNLDPLDEPQTALLDQAVEVFRTAVDLRMSETYSNGISLSGGMDSRVLAAAADPSRYRVRSVTSGLPGCIDESVTDRIARASGFEHVFFEFDVGLKRPSRSLGQSLILESIKRTDGMRGTASGAMTAFSARKLREYDLEILLTGHGGEIVKLDNAYGFSIRNSDELRQAENNFQDWAYRRMSRESAPRYPKQALYQGRLAEAVSDAPRQALEASLSRLDPGLPVAQKVSYLFLNELFRKRAVYALSVLRAYTEIRLPFYDDDFLGLMVRTPYSMRSRGKVHHHIIGALRPALMEIPLSDTRIRPNPTRFEKLVHGIPVRVLKKLGFFKKDFPEDFFQANSDEAFFRGILEDRQTVERGYFNPGEIDKLIHANARGRRDVYALLHFLVILELWHREYIDRAGNS